MKKLLRTFIIKWPCLGNVGQGCQGLPLADLPERKRERFIRLKPGAQKSSFLSSLASSPAAVRRIQSWLPDLTMGIHRCLPHSANKIGYQWKSINRKKSARLQTNPG
jgi:hypothetical protein